MNDWLRFLFGLEPGEIPASGDTHWELSNLPHGTWLGIAILAVSFASAVGKTATDERFDHIEKMMAEQVRS